MDSLFQTIFPCLPVRPAKGAIQLPTDTDKHQLIHEKIVLPSPKDDHDPPKISNDEAAASIVSAMCDAKEIGISLAFEVESLVHQAGGWSEYLAQKILTGLETVLKAGKEMNPALKGAYNEACEATKEFKEFVAEHPLATGVFCTVIAVGVLVILAPYAVEALGFGELGPIEGSWAAAWQSTFRGWVPKKSLFSFFQRLGMIWKHS